MTAQGSARGGATTATADGAGGPAPSGSTPDSAQLAEILKGIDKTHVGAAMSKMISASIGDIAMVFARSPQHKHYTFADIEWMILPAVMTGQFYVAELAQKDTGARAPVAAVLWASVSDETDARLTANPAMRIRLRPDEWQAGENLWIVDTAGEMAGCCGGSDGGVVPLLDNGCATEFDDAVPDNACSQVVISRAPCSSNARSASEYGAFDPLVDCLGKLFAKSA